MDKETISTYGFILITTILISILIVMATPIGHKALDDMNKKTEMILQNSGIINTHADMENYGILVVHYQYADESGDFSCKKTQIRKGEKCMINYPEISGYSPQLYINDKKQDTLITSIDVTQNELHIKIKYYPREYSIKYVLNGGKINGKYVESYTYNSKEILLPTPENVTKEGYKFVGWFTDNGLGGDRIEYIDKKDIGDKVFYAKYSPV